MRVFSVLYDKTIHWAGHRHAQLYLAMLSFSESSFFPVPPDVMLIPMALAQNKKAWKYAGIATIFSVVGGVFGYLIGHFAFDIIQPYLHSMGLWEKFEIAQSWFAHWGFWALFIAGFTPIPYKVFTIAAGLVSMSIVPFILASVIGRGSRFFLLAGLIRWGGERMNNMLRTYIDRMGWMIVLLAVIIYLILQV